MIREVDALNGMGALNTKEAVSMGAMKNRLNKVDKANWTDMKFYKNNAIAGRRKHKRFREVVQSCILHSSESWSWSKEMVHALHGWESWNLDHIEVKKMGTKGDELGIVQNHPDRESKTKDLLKEEERTLNIWCWSEFGVTRRRYLTRRGTKRRTK